MQRIFSRRNLLGAGLFLIMVGELTVALYSGLLTPPGLIVLGVLYLLLFLLYEALAVRYNLSYLGIVLLNFSIYSVLITGLLHGEIADYVQHPENNLITTLIRIQCSFFPLFAYLLINKLAPRKVANVPKLSSVIVAWVVFMALLSQSQDFGLAVVARTFQQVPALATVFTVAAMLAAVFALRSRATSDHKPKRWTLVSSWLLFAICLIPTLPAFMIVVIAMPVLGILALKNSRFRHSGP